MCLLRAHRLRRLDRRPCDHPAAGKEPRDDDRESSGDRGDLERRVQGAGEPELQFVKRLRGHARPGLRRQESVHLWVVRRSDIHDLADLDLLQPPLDRSFKKPGGYVMRDKLAAAREISGRAKPPANRGSR